jgi:hypothetical protein
MRQARPNSFADYPLAVASQRACSAGSRTLPALAFMAPGGSRLTCHRAAQTAFFWV